MSALDRFRDLHAAGTFVMPNAWDIGSARLLEQLGFVALATTSSGHAGSLGRLDQHVSRDELVAHAEALATSVGVPLSVDAEGCFPDEPGGVERTVSLLATTGAAGCSIEDYDPRTGTILPLDVAVERVAEAVAGARTGGLVLTARAENVLHGINDLDDTIARLVAYGEQGADVLYAPGLAERADIERVVREAGRPVNVLARAGAPSVPELADAGVRRVSTGGALAWVAYGALMEAGRELLERGTTSYLSRSLTAADRVAAFDH
jgi:2-methylisocitrate lyase-like PEP mutase family enzyme